MTQAYSNPAREHEAHALPEISNTEDIMDSRDVIARVEKLESEIEDAEAGDDKECLQDELKTLTAFVDEADSSPDWQHGETLIRDTYFREYAQQLAEDIGAINDNATWPMGCIDWDQAVRELKMDYLSADFDGVEYWIHA